MKEKNDSQAVQALFRVQYEGAAYVQIQFKDQDAKRRALASVTACDLHVRQVFDNAPALVGYTTNEGLEKLSKSPDVVGICLDDRPLPESDKIITKNDLPPATPGEVDNEPGVADKKVDPDVYRALKLHDRVYVLVSLTSEPLSKPSDGSTDIRSSTAMRKKTEKQLQDRVLTTLNADEFRLWVRLGPGMGGFVKKNAIAKLLTHPDVRLIRLDERRSMLERKEGKRFAP